MSDPNLLTPFAPPPPIPSDPQEAARWEHSRLRRRLLYGLWKHDLQARYTRAMGKTRTDAIGCEIDLSSNPFAAACAASSALYDREPLVGHAEGQDVVGAMQALVSRGGLWPQMQRTMRDVLGLRECFVRVDALLDPMTSQIEMTYRPVYPDLVACISDPERPERPIEVREARLRTDPRSNKLVWTWEIWSLVGDPHHQILSSSSNIDGSNIIDVSSLYGLPEGGLVGGAYPCRRSDGRAILPYVLHHAARTGTLWDSWHGMEVVEGTLNVGVLWTFFADCVRNASWPARYTIGAEPAGSGVEGANGTERTTVQNDPKFVLQMRASEDSQGQATAGQWAPSSDPQVLSEAIGQYERRLAAFAGLDPSDVQRMSGDPRSGYAIAIGREGRREAQRRYAPIFAPADEEVLSLTAVLANRALGTDALPEDGWTVDYESLPASPEEQQGQREHVLALLAAQLIDQTEARKMLGLAPQAA